MFAGFAQKAEQAIKNVRQKAGKPSTESDEKIKVRKDLYWGSILGYVLILIILAIVFHKLWWGFLIVGALHFIASWRILSNQEYGGIMMFEIPLAEARIGPNFVLLGLMSMGTLPRPPQQKQFPDEPELVFNDDDKLPLPTIIVDGEERLMARPFRALSGGPEKDYDSHLNIQATAKFTGTVRWRIKNFFAFWIQMPGHTAKEKITEAERQMYDTWANTIVTEAEIRPAGKIVAEGKKIRDEIKTNLDLATAPWGVDILEVTLRSPDFGHDLNDKLIGIGEANAEAEQTRTRASATAFETEVTGKAQAEIILAKRKADTEADVFEAEKLGIQGVDIFAARAAERIIGDKDKIMLGTQSFAEGLATAFNLKDVFKGRSSK